MRWMSAWQCGSMWVLGAYFCVPVCQLFCLCHWSAWRWQCGWVNPFVSLSPEGGGLSSCRLQLGNPSQRVGGCVAGRDWKRASERLVWGKRVLQQQSAAGGGRHGRKQVRVLPTRLSQPLLRLAVLTQLGTSYWQLGSHATFHKGMNGQVRAGKGETRACAAKGWQEGSEPGKATTIINVTTGC